MVWVVIAIWTTALKYEPVFASGLLIPTGACGVSNLRCGPVDTGLGGVDKTDEDLGLAVLGLLFLFPLIRSSESGMGSVTEQFASTITLGRPVMMLSWRSRV